MLTNWLPAQRKHELRNVKFLVMRTRKKTMMRCTRPIPILVHLSDKLWKTKRDVLKTAEIGKR